MAKKRKPGLHGDTSTAKPKTWAHAERADVAILVDAMTRHHEELHAEFEAGKFNLGFLTVDPARDRVGHPKGPALTVGGWPATARVRVCGQRERCTSDAEATIEVDLAAWSELSEVQKTALVDHELTHLVIETDKHDKPKRDHRGRVKLRVRPHDYEASGFHEVVARHKRNAPEVRAFVAIFDDGGQQLFGFIGSHGKRHKKQGGPRLAAASRR